MSEEIQKTLAQEIADTLGEKQVLSRKQIETIVERYGEDGARALLQETLDSVFQLAGGITEQTEGRLCSAQSDDPLSQCLSRRWWPMALRQSPQ